MNKEQAYPIGTPGQKWGDAEKALWLSRQSIKREYSIEVLQKLEGLKEKFIIEKYGALSCDPSRYPLFIARSRDWDEDKTTALVSGGVHGYETSGVQGAIRFLETRAQDYLDDFNLLVAPCISPWGYETINRWNPKALDPNRSFRKGSGCEESLALMGYLETKPCNILLHIDLHETTDTDNSEFRPALAARDGIVQDNWNIPDGFYLVGDADRPAAEFQRAIIQSVEQVTHIAPADEDGKLIGAMLEQFGVINYAARPLGLCMGLTDARFVTTTEVYPDSPSVNDENCIQAQVAAVVGGLEYLRGQSSQPWKPGTSVCLPVGRAM